MSQSSVAASTIIADITAAVLAVLSVGNIFHDRLIEFQFHDMVGTIAGLMAISYYLYLFAKWLRSWFK